MKLDLDMDVRNNLQVHRTAKGNERNCTSPDVQNGRLDYSQHGRRLKYSASFLAQSSPASALATLEHKAKFTESKDMDLKNGRIISSYEKIRFKTI